MNRLTAVLESLRGLDLERWAGLRPSYPPVAVEIDRREMVLVRVQRRGRGRPSLEGHNTRPMPEHAVGTSMFRPNLGAPDQAIVRVRELFEATGTRPGRISLVVPDNLARVSLMTFPERPPNRKHVEEMIRFKLRRAVPFRLEEAVISHQVLPSSGRELNLLVALMLRSVVEQYEQVLEAAGARPGLVDLSTLSLFNLCRLDLERHGSSGRDVALLNCARGYFALIISRNGRLLFYRCKTHGQAGQESGLDDSVLARELATSLSYYQEKLGGEGIAATLLRTVSAPVDAMAPLLDRLGFGEVVPIDPFRGVSVPGGVAVDPALGHRIAPALGAAAGKAL